MIHGAGTFSSSETSRTVATNRTRYRRDSPRLGQCSGMTPEARALGVAYNSDVTRGGIALLAFVLVAAGCGSSSGRPATESGAGRPQYTLRQVKAAFAAQGFTLQRLPGHRGGLVVLADLQRAGAFGYQRVGDKKHSGKQFLVFVGNGPHSAQQGNVWVGFSDGDGPAVRASLHQLATTAGK